MKKDAEKKRFPVHDRLIFRIHALRQMFSRQISDGEIIDLLKCGTIIEDYPGRISPMPAVLYPG